MASELDERIAALEHALRAHGLEPPPRPTASAGAERLPPAQRWLCWLLTGRQCWRDGGRPLGGALLTHMQSLVDRLAAVERNASQAADQRPAVDHDDTRIDRVVRRVTKRAGLERLDEETESELRSFVAGALDRGLPVHSPFVVDALHRFVDDAQRRARG